MNNYATLAAIVGILAGITALEGLRPDVYANEAEMEVDRVRVQNCLAYQVDYWKLEEPGECRPRYRL